MYRLTAIARDRTLPVFALIANGVIGASCAGDPPNQGIAGELAGAAGSLGGSSGGNLGQGMPAAGNGGTAPAAGGTQASGGSGGMVLSLPQDAGTGGSAGGEDGLAPLEECPSPSVDRLQEWNASGEGTTQPATGTILVQDGDHYVGHVVFIDDGMWKVVPVLIANRFGDVADLGASSGFWLTYSATADFYVQLRSRDEWNGGRQYAIQIPSTAGEVQRQFFEFDEAQWASLFGPPVLSFSQTLPQVQGFVFVGQGQNDIRFEGLRIDGYVPDCR